MNDRGEKLVSVVVLIVSFGAAILAVILIGQHREETESFISNLGVFGPILVVIFYAGLAFSPIPADSLTLINGAVYGPIRGALIAWVGILTATVVEYFVGTRIGEAAEFEKIRSGLPWGLGDLPVDSVLFLLGGRLLTSAGSKIVSILSGIYRINFWRYLWTSGASTLFGYVVFTLFGTGLLQIF